MSNLEFIKSLTKKYQIKIEQKLDDIEEDTMMDNSDFYADSSIPIVEKIQKLAEEQSGILISLEDIEKYIT